MAGIPGAGSLGTSALIYYQMEKPGIRMSKFLFQRKPKKPDLAQT
jgi:hypothetical protein